MKFMFNAGRVIFGAPKADELAEQVIHTGAGLRSGATFPVLVIAASRGCIYAEAPVRFFISARLPA
jgi:hypothetical protein